MAKTQIRGNTQIIAATVTDAEIAAAAAIATSKLADGSNFLKRDGSVALTANLPAGGFLITGLGTPSGPNDVASKSYVDAVAAGFDPKGSVRVATTANITLSGTQTIDGVALSANDRVLVKNQSAGADNGYYLVAAGAWTRTTDADTSAKVTSGAYTFVSEGTANGSNGFTLITADPITLGTTALVFTQTTGAGQIIAGTGLSKTGNTLAIDSTVATLTGTQTLTNKTITSPLGIVKSDVGLSVVENTALSTWAGTANLTTLGTISTGTWQGGLIAGQYGGTGVNNSGKTITLGGNLTTSGAFATTLTMTAATSVTLPTSGTLATQAGTETLTNKSIVATQLTGTLQAGQFPTLTGDVTTAGGALATTIAASSVTLAKMANLAANSLIGNSTGSSATPTAISMLATSTANAVALRDGNANLRANNFVGGLATTATAAGTTTLTVSSTQTQQFTGTTTQTVVLPDATTLSVGHSFTIANRSSGVVTVNANGGGLLQVIAAGNQATFSAVTVGTTAGAWDVAYSLAAAGGSGTVTSVSVATANGFAGTSNGNASSPALTLTTSVTGLLKGNGTAISAATLNTDYVNAASFVTRETPSGTQNGSNATFTLANTPITGTEHVYFNGALQEPGAGNDYTISGATITWLTPFPVATDKIRVSYMK